MFVGRALYLLGMAVVFFSIVVLIMSFFSNGGVDFMIPLFALLNGLIAMGVGDLVIDVNHRQRVEKMK
ncbi:hypothetical protein M3172_24735 [Mesobacillus subterraneus]|uniref:hypothetical protein n=1 Tax=Mesobacillus subterraneus TaxID=285983 RepID=UPI00203E2290|nr:hypothetical protein [Mesobacillus subterraneus]MCM3576377.1 hypothetical protein [Mesobacillus subterraneus]